jgi:hypothetical protein
VLEPDLFRHFRFPAIIDFDSYSPQTVHVLLNTLNPYSAGVLVGGGLSVDVQQEVENVVQKHNMAELYKLKLVCIPLGIREQVGAADYLNGSKMRWARSLV